MRQAVIVLCLNKDCEFYKSPAMCTTDEVELNRFGECDTYSEIWVEEEDDGGQDQLPAVQ